MIQISEEVVKNMYYHAIETYPNECCGFFFGSVSGNDKMINASYKVENRKEGDQRRRFEVSPEDYMKGEVYADENNTLFSGVYHSHPNHPAVPSAHDLKQAVPFFSYIIISVENNKIKDIRSWKLDEKGKFSEEEIKIINKKNNLKDGKSNHSNAFARIHR